MNCELESIIRPSAARGLGVDGVDSSRPYAQTTLVSSPYFESSLPYPGPNPPHQRLLIGCYSTAFNHHLLSRLQMHLDIETA